ncbi:MAG TPA: hypothetical protein VH092_30925 [Urbifossiella sp.]|jgi:hypothetical protein|nr:hypothetical protein [Urbifossiella sp.]
MRAPVVVTLGLVWAGLVAGRPAAGQEKPPPPEEIPPRYGQQFKPKAYPQATAKEALQSVISAAEKGDYAYLTAHLIDPAFVDARLDAMSGGPGSPYRKTAEAELVRLRDIQRTTPDAVPAARRVPENPKLFDDRLAADARGAAFAQLTRAIQDKFTDDPEVLKDLRKFVRGAAFPDPGAPGDAAKVELADVKDRAVFLKRAAGRWYVENKMAEEKAPPAPEPKKE